VREIVQIFITMKRRPLTVRPEAATFPPL